MPWPSRLTLYTCCSFKKSIANLYLKGNQKYSRSKQKLQNLLNESSSFNIDLSYSWCPLRYKIMQCLILKLILIVNESLEGQGMAWIVLNSNRKYGSNILKVYLSLIFSSTISFWIELFWSISIRCYSNCFQNIAFNPFLRLF